MSIFFHKIKVRFNYALNEGAFLVLLFAVYFLSTFTSSYSQIKYARETNTFFAVALYSLITCLVSSLFFLSLTGFSPIFNKTTFIFALLFSIVVIISQYVAIIVYKYMRILDFGLIRGSISLISTFAIGAIWYNEKITIVAIVRMLLSLAATLTLLLNKHNEKSKIKNTFLGYILCFVCIIAAVFNTILSKEFASLPQKQDENSYFLLVNIICLTFSLLLILFIKKGSAKPIFNELKNIGKLGYLYIFISTLSSNLSSLVTLWLLAGKVSIVLYTPLTAAMGIIVQILTAAIIGKEKIPKIPIILSLSSAVLSFSN